MILQSQNLFYKYKKSKSFSFPDLECSRKQELLILGDSGKGKSTLLHLLGLVLPIQLGNISISGTSINHLNAKESALFRARNIGLIFQQNHFVKSLNVIDNLLLPNYYANNSLNKKRAYRLASILKIDELLKKSFHQISGGELQRINIARALMNNPTLVLADEPTSNLDDHNCQKVYELLVQCTQEENAALIIVTHDQRLKDRVQNQIIL